MGMEDKVGGGDDRQAVVTVEMQDNKDSGNRDTVMWIWRQRRRERGNRIDVGRRRKRFGGQSILMGVDALQRILPIERRKGGVGSGIGDPVEYG